MKKAIIESIAKVTTTTSISLAALLVSTSAGATSFIPFSFTTNVTASADLTNNPNLVNDPTRDIRLDSVVAGGSSFNQFELVQSGRVIQNDTYILRGNTYGILHSGRGPNTVSDPLVEEGPSKPNPTGQDIADTLGNLNLNSILVTRENADTAIIEVSFNNPVNTFFFWERGGSAGGSVAGDSDLLVEALSDDNSTVLASYRILRRNYSRANYNISTRVNDINLNDPPLLNNGPFNIGSIGLSLKGIQVKNLRLSSTGNNLGSNSTIGFNGPDFKIVATSVPEPLTIVGTITALGLGSIFKRKLSRIKG